MTDKYPPGEIDNTYPLTPDRHYRRADELLRDGLDYLRNGGTLDEKNIPTLLLALAHATLARTDDETWRRATWPDDVIEELDNEQRQKRPPR